MGSVGPSGSAPARARQLGVDVGEHRLDLVGVGAEARVLLDRGDVVT
jgi:hypothetical protein